MQGRIMMEVLDEVASTALIIFRLEEDDETVRNELARLHLTGILQIVGISDQSRRGAMLYDKDFVWDLSTHGRYHHDNLHGCIFCQRRATLIVASYPSSP